MDCEVLRDAFLPSFLFPITQVQAWRGRGADSMFVMGTVLVPLLAAREAFFLLLLQFCLKNVRGPDWTLLLISAVLRPCGSPPWTFFHPLLAQAE